MGKNNFFNVNTAIISADDLNKTVKRAKINANGYPRLEVNGKSKCLSNKSFGIGRDKRNSLIIADAKVSKFHAIISFARGTGYIRDSFSLNGTYLNGKRLPPGSGRHSAQRFSGQHTKFSEPWPPVSYLL